MVNLRCRASEIGLKVVSTNEVISENRTGEILAEINPDSILDKIKDIIDQLDQVITAGVNGFGIADLFFVQVTFCIFIKLLCKDQQTVQRRTQLMRHICQEL